MSLTPFQRHLQFFGLPQPPHRITILSSLRASFRSGLDFPVALILSLGLRVLYGTHLSSPIDIAAIPRHLHRTQLEQGSASADEDRKRSYSLSDLLDLYASDPSSQRGLFTSLLDRAHILSFWSISARKDLRVDASDFKRFKEGTWEQAVVERRRGRADVSPFWRGGPIIVSAHSWFVRTLFGVRVYERE